MRVDMGRKEKVWPTNSQVNTGGSKKKNKVRRGTGDDF